MWQYKNLMSYMVINSLILSMWYAYNNYNFEVYIKLEESCQKEKRPCEIYWVRGLKNTST